MIKENLFEVYYKSNYACLTVYPAPEESSKLYPEDIIGRLKVLDIRGARTQTILDAIEDASGVPIPLVLWPEGKKLGPKISLHISEDRLTASLIIQPARQGGEPLSVEMLTDFLHDHEIKYGIRKDVLETAILRRLYGEPVKVAFGTPPVDEKPPQPEYTFITERGKPFRELEFMRIDLKELNFIQNKAAGELLARLLPPQRPEDGIDIFGDPVPAERGVTAPQFEAGDGAVLSEDGNSIFAAVEGNTRLDRGKVIVEPLISVEDVDYSNGNMDFNGSVDIRGRVADGFVLNARGDIQIGKSVSRVNIASEGDIILKAGITGNDEGIIICGGDLYARYIENARIICRGNIFVEEAVMHSNVRAGGDIILAGKRAEIFGGRIFSAGRIKCKKIGSINEPVTELFLGTDLDSYTAMDALQKTVSNHSRRVDDLALQIRQIKNARKSQQSEVSAEKLEAALAQLQQDSETENSKLGNTLRELHDLKRGIQLNENSEVEADQQIFGNVYVYFNHLRWESPGKGTGKTRLIVKQGKLLEK